MPTYLQAGKDLVICGLRCGLEICRTGPYPKTAAMFTEVERKVVDPLRPRWLGRASVLLIADLFQPVDYLAVLLFLNGDVHHRRGRRGPMPMLLAGRKPDYIAGPNFFDWTGPALGASAASRDDENLAERMRVPGSSRARLEGDAGALHECRVGSMKKRIDSHRASEPLRWSLRGRLRANSFDFHFARYPALQPRGPFGYATTLAISSPHDRSRCLVNHLHLFFIHPATVHSDFRHSAVNLAELCRRQLHIDCCYVLV